jgi:poly-gamma-glutamate synthase PgsB/CapB
VTELPLLSGALGLLLAAGLAERLLRDRALRAIPVRVHVNGTRGKSTVTRLVAAALRAHGVPTLAKVTGTEARVILPDGSERPLRRRGRPNVREQLAFLRLARRLRARAVVAECMAIRPDLQAATEDDMLRATVGVVTNVRTDHTEVMGSDLAAIAAALSSTVPRGGVLVLGEPAFEGLFSARARERGTRVVVAEPAAAGAPSWLDECTATALAVTRLLGVPDDAAREAMRAAAPDPGAFRAFTATFGGSPVPLLDARAANDPESLLALAASAPELSGARPIVAVYNHRHDRPDRLLRFAPALASLAGGPFLVTGDAPAFTLARAVRRASGNRDLPFVPAARLRGALAMRHPGAVLLCGNTRGLDPRAVAGLPGGPAAG